LGCAEEVWIEPMHEIHRHKLDLLICFKILHNPLSILHERRSTLTPAGIVGIMNFVNTTFIHRLRLEIFIYWFNSSRRKCKMDANSLNQLLKHIHSFEVTMHSLEDSVQRLEENQEYHYSELTLDIHRIECRIECQFPVEPWNDN
ncbi:MAG: hypothetical protein SGJ24_08425, partial [Chloroflexota bacterium]|nr:hypothetical protein [Chloroflexota bacterium]